MLGSAPVAELSEPFLPNPTVAGARLSACNEPVDVRQVETVERAEERLGRDEPHLGFDSAQIVGAVHETDGSRW